MRKSFRNTFLFVAFAFPAVVNGDGESYGDRQEYMRNIAESSSSHAPLLQACRNQPVDDDLLDRKLVDLDQNRDAAFDIIILVRMLFCGSIPDTTEEKILGTLAPIPFWLESGEDTRVYWTENQQIMWMSSEWLLKENYPSLKQYSPTLKERLLHYLNMKIEWGFVEFFSSVYFPYTLSGLLNLVDFCGDPEVQSLAEQATQKLLELIISVSNDQGEMLAASARNRVGYYLGDPAIQHIIWMIRGVGPTPTYAHQTTAFLSTSGFDTSSLLGDYEPKYDGSVYAGPSLSESFGYNENLTRIDRTIFQWSYGAYFHPDTAADTQYVLQTLDLEGHGEFGDFSAFTSLPPSFGNFGSQLLASITRSSVTAGFNIEIFRHGPSVLTSARNFWEGRIGFQSWPWMATTGTLPVWTQSGTVKEGWPDRNPSNTHLPKVKQDSNVALIMYNRNNDLSLAGGVLDFDVSLHWPVFDEDIDIGLWKVGHELQSGGYVAVRRHCGDTIDGIPACGVEHQTWAVVVGNAAEHGSFEEFSNKVQAATYEHSYKWSWSCFCNVFKGKIEFDGILIEHEW